MALGDNIKLMRRSREWTPSDLAKAADVKKVNHIKTGAL